MIKSDRNLRPEPGYTRRQTSTVAEMKAHPMRHAAAGAQLRLKDAASGTWYFENDRCHLFPRMIANRERKGLRVAEAWWLPKGTRLWRPISLADVRAAYRIE